MTDPETIWLAYRLTVLWTLGCGVVLWPAIYAR